MGHSDARKLYTAIGVALVVWGGAVIAVARQTHRQAPQGQRGQMVSRASPAAMSRRSVRDAYNAVSPGMTEQAIVQTLGTPASSAPTPRPGVYAGAQMSVDQPQLPAGRIDTGETKLMAYDFPDGRLLIYLAGTADGDHPQTGGSGEAFVSYRSLIVASP